MRTRTTPSSATLRHSAALRGSASPRLVTPDATRGLLLLFIALANVPLWTHARVDDASPLAGVLSGAMALLVDGRCYPVFAMLFGYGLATLAERAATKLEPYSLVLRRIITRMAALFVIGALHAALFRGDILSPYALAGIIAAPLIIRARSRILAYVAGGMYVLELVAIPAYQLLRAVGAHSPQNLDPARDVITYYHPELHFVEWAVNTLVLGPISLLPLLLLGALLRRYRIIARYPSRPWQLRRAAIGLPLLSLVIAISDGTMTRTFTGDSLDSALSIPNNIAGLLMALGYIAIFAWIFHRWDGRPRAATPWWVRTLRAVGQRSLTCYLLQSVLFAVLVAPWGPVGWGEHTNYPMQLGIAVAIWVVLAGLAHGLAALGWPGPLDAVLRRVAAWLTPAPSPAPQTPPAKER